jgi:hypothetical protein
MLGCGSFLTHELAASLHPSILGPKRRISEDLDILLLHRHVLKIGFH